MQNARVRPHVTAALAARSSVWRYVWIVGLVLAVWWFRGVLLMAFASALIAMALCALSSGVTRLTRMPRLMALVVVGFSIVGFVAAALALFGWRVADQYDEILARIQASYAELIGFAQTHGWTRYLADRLGGMRLDGSTAQFAPALASTLGSVGQIAAYSAIVVASGVFLAIEPERHIRGALLLVPPPQRGVAKAFLDEAGRLLRQWLMSRFIVMVAIGVLSSAGLWLLHIKGALALGLTGGLLTFIPLVGALIAAVPAILVALAQSPLHALYVGLMYWAVHFIEGTFITPYVQDEEVDLPPVLTMYSALIGAALFGPGGVLLSSPLALLAILAARMFYVRSEAAPLAGGRSKEAVSP